MSGIPVLMYHWVDGNPGGRLGRYGIHPRSFERQLAWLAARGWHCVSLEALCEHLAHRSVLPARSFVLTFDDGYADLETRVAPALERHGFFATVFIVTSYAGRTNVWDAIHGDPPRRLLNWESIRRLDGKHFRFASHSCSHPFLPRLGRESAWREIADSKRRLEDELGREIDAFSYPYGLFNRPTEEMVTEAGYRCAVTDIRGLNGRLAHPLRIRRVMIVGNDHHPGFAFKVRTGHDLYSGLRAVVGLTTNAPDDLRP